MHFRKFSKPVLSFVVMIAISLGLVIFLAGSGAAAPPAGDEEFGIIADAGNAFLNSSPLIYMQPQDLMTMLDDNGDGVIGGAGDNLTNDPLVIDVRSAADYSALGHIPGAINIAYKDVAKSASMATITTELAKHCNKTIVLACYSGHTDKLAEMALGSAARAGFFGTPAPRVTALKWGNLGWNTPSEAATVLPEVVLTAGKESSYIYSHNYAIETTDHPLPAVSAYPVIDNTASLNPGEITRVAVDLSLTATAAAPPFIFPGTTAGKVNDINDADPANGDYIGLYTVVDVRSAADYAAGHIIGAVNIPYKELFAKDGLGDYTNLLKIDRSKPIIVYENGQQEANAAIIGMNALGIRNAAKATRSLRYGIASWNNNNGMKFDPATEEHSYPVVTGVDPGGPVTSGSGCIAAPDPVNDRYYLTPWYDSTIAWGMNAWLVMTNMTDHSLSVEVTIGGISRGTETIPSGGHLEKKYTNTSAGPAVVRVPNGLVSGDKLTVSERTLYKSSFNETMFVDTSTAGSSYAWAWYDNNAAWGMMGDWIAIVNADSTDATVDVFVGDLTTPKTTKVIAPGQTQAFQIMPPMYGGPVKVTAQGGKKILASQRVIYLNSFNEVFGNRLP
ncbi:MAG: rhodanese-like domain-containing protein [Thermoleophilia bacterium]